MSQRSPGAGGRGEGSRHGGTPFQLTGRRGALAVCLALLGQLPLAALAVELGDLKVRSYLGQGFAAELAVKTPAPEELGPACLRLAKPQTQDGLASLVDAELSYQPGPTGGRLRIQGRRPIHDLAFRVAVAVECGINLQREYVVLLDPKPQADDAQPAAEPREAAPAARLPAATPAAVRQPHARPARQEVAPRRATPAPLAGPRLARELRGDGQDRLSIGGGAGDISPRLRLSHELGAAGLARGISAAEREQLRQTWQLMQRLAEAQRNIEGLLRGEIPAGALPPLAAVEPPPAAAPAVPAPPPVQSPPQVEAPAVAPEPHSFSAIWWLVGIPLLALPMGIALYRWRRRNLHPEPVDEAPPSPDTAGFTTWANFPPVPPGDAPAPRPAAAPAPVSRIQPKPQEVVTKLDFTHLQGPPTTEGTAGGKARPHIATVMDLADVMLSFGQTDSAMDALREFLQEHPDAGVDPWVRMFDLLRTAGKRDEFEALAARVNLIFNIEPPAWDDVATTSASPGSLEGYDHLCRQLTDNWPAPACAELLDRLLRDNRGGTRRGFPLAVVEELLLLRNMLGALQDDPPQEPAAAATAG